MSTHPHDTHAPRTHDGHYDRLLVMVGLSFLAMYALMYAMVDGWGNVYGKVNQI